MKTLQEHKDKLILKFQNQVKEVEERIKTRTEQYGTEISHLNEDKEILVFQLDALKKAEIKEK